MKRIFFVCMAGLLIFSLSACSSGGETAHTSGGQNESGVDSSDVESISGVNKMGAISPEDALTYMKNTPDLVIVEVNAPEWKLSTGFTGAMYIPYTEMADANHVTSFRRTGRGRSARRSSFLSSAARCTAPPVSIS